jgi:hypothetical protein
MALADSNGGTGPPAKGRSLAAEGKPAVTATSAAAPHGTMNSWEQRKRDLLAQLEVNDTPRLAEPNGEPTRKPNGAEAGPKATDKSAERLLQLKEALEQRDREIARLRRQVDELTLRATSKPACKQAEPEAAKSLASDGAAVQPLEKELQTRLAQMEVELSLERAGLARERTRLEEWQRELEMERRRLGMDRQQDAANPKQGEATQCGSHSGQKLSLMSLVERLGFKKS